MQTQHTSLGDQIAEKISTWIFILIGLVIAVISAIALLLCHQFFNKQTQIWNTITPQQTVSSLTDSDYFSIKRDIEFLRSTGLFSSFLITDNKKKVIAEFGNHNLSTIQLIPIQDGARKTWGYYYFQPDFYQFIAPYIIALGIFSAVVLLVYFFIRWRIRHTLASEFSKFNLFLSEIENITRQLPEICKNNGEFKIISGKTSEQIIINEAISRLVAEIIKTNHALREAITHSEQKRFREELTQTAMHMAHDIASPLAAFEMILHSTNALPEKMRISIRQAVVKIRDIAHSFLQKAKKDFSNQFENHLSETMLQLLINQVVSEKRLQYGDRVNIDFLPEENAYKIFSFIKSIELCRVLSNVINNSVEAICENNQISLFLQNINNEAVIQIKDFGKGIPDNLLQHVGELGKSFDKANGIGVGLNHAINTINSWGGRLQIESEIGQGTTVTIYLKQCSPPEWFVPEINIYPNQTIVVIDDDQSIHEVWKTKIHGFCQENGAAIQLVHFASPDQLINWKNNAENVLYFCDYEFIGYDDNGLDLIQKLNISCMSTLVTSYLTSDVIRRCEVEEIKLLPKNIVHAVPLFIRDIR